MDLASPLLRGTPEICQHSSRRAQQLSLQLAQPESDSWGASLKKWLQPASIISSVHAGDIATTHTLLRGRADPNVNDGEALAFALQGERWQLLALLVDHGGHIGDNATLICPKLHGLTRFAHIRFRCDLCGHRGDSGFGCRQCNYDLCEKCAKEVKDTPFVVALLSRIRADDHPGLELILRAGVPVDIRDRFGATSLLWAVAGGSLRLVQTLMEFNACVHAADDTGLGAVAVAAYYGDVDMLREMLVARGCANTLDRSEQTPMHFACNQGHVQVVALLLSTQANFRHRNSRGGDPLYCAAMGNHQAVVDMLIHAGVSVNGTSAIGDTSLHIASKRGDVRMVRMLLELNADTSARNSRGELPVDFARSHPEVLTILCQASAVGGPPPPGAQTATVSGTWKLHVADLVGRSRTVLDALPRDRIQSLVARLRAQTDIVPAGSLPRLVLQGRGVLHESEYVDACGAWDGASLTLVLQSDFAATGLCGKWEKTHGVCMVGAYQEKKETYELFPNGIAHYIATESYDDGDSPFCTSTEGQGTWQVNDGDNLNIWCEVKINETTAFCSFVKSHDHSMQTNRASFLREFKRIPDDA